MTRWLFFIILLTPRIFGQSLFDLAPSDDVQKPLPLTWNTRFGFGYDDNPSLYQAGDLQRFFFFGDSLTDTGNIARELGGSLGGGYPGAYFSNGPTWAKYLVPDLQLAPTIAPPPNSIDFSYGLSTTSIIKTFQIDDLFTNLAPSLRINALDHAFVMGGGNDFLDAFRSATPPTMATLTQVADDGVANLASSADSLVNTHGLQNLVVIGLSDVTRAPSISDFDVEGPAITDYFNNRLQMELGSLSYQANLLWVDSNDFLNRIILNPSPYRFVNTTDSAAPDAVSGIPSTLSPEELDGYLFYDHIHPTTAFHQKFAIFVAHHLSLAEDASDVHLLTDAALAFDNRFGFETPDLAKGQSRWYLNTSTFQNKSGAHRRDTQIVQGDLNYAISNDFLIGGEMIYTSGDSANSELETFGLGVDAILNGSFHFLDWEVGVGISTLSGDLNRDYNLGDLQAESDQSAQIYTLHGALRNDRVSLANRPAYWEVGVKQRFVHR
ncbi:SGNH/GDSL hydrolase family protein, partial [Akkermansiaceae bacterium]|nr:SGNH/GDSL hydrolase family protein [Akkermansiaceae bacterium]